MKKEIAIVIHNMVLFEQITPILEKYKDIVDLYIYIEKSSTDAQWLAMAKDTYKETKLKGFNPVYLKEMPKKEYKILIAPILYNILPKADVNIKFNYGMGKDWLHSSSDLFFDYVLCYGNRDGLFSEPYSRIMEVGAIKFYKIKKKKLNKKKTILYLPTYGEYSSIDKLYYALEKLQDEYNVIVKLHHGTTFLEPERVKLFKNFKNVYDHKASMKKLFSEADMVISDSSGAIYDAIATKTPVAIFDIKKYKLYNEKIKSGEEVLFENNLVNKFDDPKEVKNVIEKTLNDKNANKKLDKAFSMFFSCSSEEGVKKIFKLIDDILKNKIDLSIYKEAKKQLKRKEDYDFLESEKQNLLVEKNNLQKQLDYKTQVLDGVLNSKSWKLTKFLRRK